MKNIRSHHLVIGTLLLLSTLSVIFADHHVEDSDWTDWGESGECSRTCGGGVLYQERQCLTTDDEGNPACHGPQRIYRSCNIQDCPVGSQDFRQAQCEKYNGIEFEGQFHEWLPYYGAENKCELNCLAKGQNFYYRLASKVIDGTQCNQDSMDVCVDGVCQPVGCDKMLNSGVEFDVCMECGGDNSSCTTVSDAIDTHHLKNGYHDLLLIPSGSTSISIRESKATASYLALRDLQGSYLLNGNWRIDLPLPKEMAGTVFRYTRGKHGSDEAETLTADGPTDQPLFLVLLRQHGHHAKIIYEYSVPKTVRSAYKETYEWKTGSWQPCSASCGLGQQQRVIECERTSDGEIVSNKLCDKHRKPALNQSCSQEPCPATWHAGIWEECSTTCGEGVQIRSVYCQQVQQRDLISIVDSRHCTEPRPSSVHSCNQNVPCPKWQVGEWSQCNRVCGAGEQVRSVLCRAQHKIPNVQSDILPPQRCDAAEKPERRQACTNGPCSGLEWVVSRWSGCPDSCSEAVETRHVFCSSKSGKIFSDELCEADKKPETKRDCPPVDGCQSLPQWHASEWGRCSSRCGSGIQLRRVTCAKMENNTLVMMAETKCERSNRMVAFQNCTGTSCTGVWFSGPWGKCSAPCGGGQRKREVLCFQKDLLVDPSECNPNTRPDAYGDCNSDPCDEDNLLVVGGCKGTEFGCCPDGITVAEGQDYLNCPAKDSIPRGACLETEFGCCHDGVLPAQGPFNFGCPDYTCEDTLYRCCGDGQTPAAGPNGEGCPVVFGCEATAFGCCEDGKTPSNGFNGEGCKEKETHCEKSPFGCCFDGKKPARGPNGQGCDEGSGSVCEDSLFGCCSDGITQAGGPNGEGCSENEIDTSCAASYYGCCPDGFKAATGPAYQGCPGVLPHVPSSCANTGYGCCEDGQTAALGPNYEGCDGPVQLGCDRSSYGCCPDGVTEAQGYNYEGCDEGLIVGGCAGTRHGCCPDNVNAAYGPNFEGCDLESQETQCDRTRFGCCPDGYSVAAGPNFRGCDVDVEFHDDCRWAEGGCCPDGVSFAQNGCPDQLAKVAVCSEPSDTGPCTNYSVMWHYDPLAGECTRFWYGGCDGNGNRFNTQAECESTCVAPEGTIACYLPKSIGRCRKSVPRFFYNHETRSCEEFIFGGCTGNKNNFETERECEANCTLILQPDVCSQPNSPGPCKGNFPRWFYHAESGLCRQFVYGGCRGNDNRFETEGLCQQRCKQSIEKICQLAKDPGPCFAEESKYYFNFESKRCEEFTYGGCRGNGNRFSSQSECERACHELLEEKEVDPCTQPQDAGRCLAYMQRWYYDQTDGYCKQFIYGGCEGNLNRFETEAECRGQCNARPPIDVCTLPQERGRCLGNNQRFHFDSVSGQCLTFVYGGCEGNDNNFETIEECRKTCSHHTRITVPPQVGRCQLPREAGRCTNYMSRYFYDTETGRCEHFYYGGCNGNRNKFMTVEECTAECVRGEERVAPTEPAPTTTPTPSTAEPEQPVDASCFLRQDAGSCYAYMPSWFYNKETQKCEEFIYGGCGGNTNRFATKPDCQRACSREDICSLPSQGGSCGAYIISWYYDKERRRCLQFVYTGCNGNANRFETVEECEGRCQGVTPEDPNLQVSGLAICGLPAERGMCGENLRKWHYDTESGQCKEFIYSGCEGNYNNFNSREECEGHCPVTNICYEPAETGPCRAAIRKYYFDANANECRPYTYGGCAGNANRFSSMEACRRVCQPQEPETQQPDVYADPCTLPMDRGPCTALYESWYYEVNQGQCLRFNYGGCGGNYNRFNDRESCEQRCGTTAVVNPNQPDPYQPDRPVDPNEPDPERPIDPFAPVEPNVGSDVCDLPKDPGPCTENFTAVWYFEPTRRQCRRFLYGGCPGNDNRFGSRDECESRCLNRDGGGGGGVYEPEPQTYPPVQPTYAPQRTAYPPYETPQPTVYPPYEPSEETEFDACMEPVDVGPCRAAMQRYYYDAATGACREFIYGGCQGNPNRFNSLGECEQACLWKNVVSSDPCSPPKAAGYCGRIIQSYYYDKDTNMCRKFNYTGCAGNSNRFSTLKACHARCAGSATPRPTTSRGTTTIPSRFHDICALPPDRGPCDANIRRWYFDAQRQICVDFVYGGCRGNSNNFATKKKCRLICKSRLHDNMATPPPWVPAATSATDKATTGETEEPVDVCRQPKKTGPCKALFEKWYFDDAARTCLRFNYGGCDANQNNFDTAEDCYYRCGGQPPNTDDPTPPSERCRMPVDSGPCYAAFLNFYFDDSIGECRPFTYGGCQGNENRFDTQENCYQTCGQEEKDYRLISPGDCYEPQDPGTGYDYEARWSFNADKAQCEPFYYSKPGGNRNNFHSYEDCLAMCVRGATVPCRPLACDLNCPFGFKQGEDGCPTCQCEDPCERYACNDGEECILEEVECVSEPCLPVPICRATDPFGTVKPGFCPQVDSNSLGICSQDCGADSDCLGTQKCCSNGCGTYCTEPEQPENKPGFCPMPDEQMRTVCENICYSDADCPDERKCCSTGCGTICMSPSHTSHGNDHYVWTTTSPAPVVERTTWMPITRDWQPPTPYYPDPYSEEHDRLEEDRHRDRHGGGHDRDPYEPTEVPPTWEWQPPTPYYPDRRGEGAHWEDQDRNRHDADRDRDHWDQNRQEGDRDRDHWDQNRQEGHNQDRDHWDQNRQEGDRDRDHWDQNRQEGHNQDRDHLDQNRQEEDRDRDHWDQNSQEGHNQDRDHWDQNRQEEDRDRDHWDQNRQEEDRERDHWDQNRQEEDRDRDHWDQTRLEGHNQDRDHWDQNRQEEDRERDHWDQNRQEGHDPNRDHIDQNRREEDRERDHWDQNRQEGHDPNRDHIDQNRREEDRDQNRQEGHDPNRDHIDLNIREEDRDRDHWDQNRQEGQNQDRDHWDQNRQEEDRDRDHWDQNRQEGYDPNRDHLDQNRREEDRDHWDQNRQEGHDRDNTIDRYPECLTSVFGCCPDNKTPASGYNYRGCPEETPQITSTGPTNVDAAEGSIVVLPCEVRAAPAAVITWYKNGTPLQGLVGEKARMLDGGALEIVDVTAEDSASYTCRAYNGIGDGATREYTIRINTGVRFVDEQSADVTVAERATARLTCAAEGVPQPRIRWLHNGRDVLYDGLRLFLEEDGSTLSIEDVSPRDEGEYICEAHNGVGEPIQRTIRLNVQGQIYAQIVAHNTSFNTGDEVHLKCRVEADGDFKISWQRNGQPLKKDSRISHPKPSQLLIKGATTDDQGTYTCLVTRDQNQFSVDTNIEVQGLSLPLNCIDKPWYANCKLIVKAKMCKHIYFSDFCCLSCHTAGLL